MRAPTIRYPIFSSSKGRAILLPYPNASFDLVVAFEVIEHLDGMARISARGPPRACTHRPVHRLNPQQTVLHRIARQAEGANPFHVHEFEFEEFRAELNSVFPHVSLFLENHVEGVTFQPYEAGNTVEVRVDAGDPAPDESHFFVAVCAHRPQLGNPTFVYVPRAGNLLRERELAHCAARAGTRHQERLAPDRAQHDLTEFDREHQKLLAMFRELKDELERSNQWADALNRDVEERSARVTGLQEELVRDQENARQMAEAYAAKVSGLEADISAKTQWARDVETNLTAEMQKQTADLVLAVEALHRTEKELHDRTDWALQLREEASKLEVQVALFRGSRWVKLGRKVGLGPEVPAG